MDVAIPTTATKVGDSWWQTREGTFDHIATVTYVSIGDNQKESYSFQVLPTHGLEYVVSIPRTTWDDIGLDIWPKSQAAIIIRAIVKTPRGGRQEGAGASTPKYGIPKADHETPR